MCYLAIIYTLDNDNIGGIIAPVFLCFLLSFWVASMFLEIFGMGIETILYCFIADEEMFAVEERFAGRELVGTLNSAQIAHTLWKARKNKVRTACSVYTLAPCQWHQYSWSSFFSSGLCIKIFAGTSHHIPNYTLNSTTEAPHSSRWSCWWCWRWQRQGQHGGHCGHRHWPCAGADLINF